MTAFRSRRGTAWSSHGVVVSFVMGSGLDMLAGPLEDHIERDARARILTTDYLQITDPHALSRSWT